MREWDYDCSLMCRIQGRIFEKSLLNCESGSSVFIKRYMNSFSACSMDNENFLNTTLSDDQVLRLINNEFPNKYGREKYSLDQMYWIGYIYRAWAYIYKMKSKDIVKICTPKEMRSLYYFHHTLDPKKAIDMIIEEKNIEKHIDLSKKLRK